MTSKNWQRFVNSFFGDPRAAWRDGLDLPALRNLEPDERAQAEHKLLSKLEAGSRDPRVVRGLGELGSARAAAGLAALLPSPAQSERIKHWWYPGFAPLVVHTAVALWRIERYPAALRYVTDVLAQLPHSFERVSRHCPAAFSLRGSRAGPEICLARRGQAGALPRRKSLLAIHDLLPSEFESPPLAIKIMSDDAALRQEAVDELESVLKDAQISGA